MIGVDLLRSAREYLALRRALGFKLYRETRLLPDFVGFVTAHGSAFITMDLAVRWAQLPAGASARWCASRLSAIRCFAKYQLAFDPRTEIPPRDLLPSRTTRRLPHLYTQAEIAAVMSEARAERPAVTAAAYETLFGLLATTGMRVGEALALDDDDIDWSRSLLKVRHAKFQKTRRVPLHASTLAALRKYIALRDRLCVRLGRWVFTSSVGTRVRHQVFGRVFRRLIRRAGLGDGPAPPPRSSPHLRRCNPP
jgi:integrase/recombinase XerD